ncbi:MAG: S4 domain-containing protein [Candidatus Levybacteria bacterium]|nr:S4 domain-containing protein [Candidatus Levybacteria bacterium]
MENSNKRERLDIVLVKKGIAPSRQKAISLIKSGKIKVQGEICKKQRHLVREDFRIELIEDRQI